MPGGGVRLGGGCRGGGVLDWEGGAGGGGGVLDWALSI